MRVEQIPSRKIWGGTVRWPKLDIIPVPLTPEKSSRLDRLPGMDISFFLLGF
jgi:hypothetical protein